MKRAFLISGPESSGNRILASLLVRSGVEGAGSTNQVYTRNKLPTDSPLALTIIHANIREPILTLRERGYEVTVLVLFRDPVACEQSMVTRGHRDSLGAAHRRVLEAYTDVFMQLTELGCPFRIVSYDYLVTYPKEVYARLAKDLGLPVVMKGPIFWDDQPYDTIVDANAQYYGLARRERRIRSD